MTPAECQGQLKRLMVLRNPPADVSAYVELLATADYRQLAAGVSLALKTRQFFPVPAELFSDCEQAKPRDTWRSSINEPDDGGPEFTHHIPNPFGSEGITVRVKRDWKYICDDCGDTGWFHMWCGDPETKKPWHHLCPCGRRGDHTPHEWVQHCACWFNNSGVIAKRERMADAAASRSAAAKDRH